MVDTSNPDPAGWTTVTLIEPSRSGFVQLAVSAGGWPLPPALPSRQRSDARRRLHAIADFVRGRFDVREAIVFTAFVRPPGGGNAATEVTYDLVLLIETDNPESAERLVASSEWKALASPVIESARDHLLFVASNLRRISPVDHSRGGVFLFNYFSAPDVASNLHAWQYTAGWFQQQTGLDNSTVLEPMAASSTPFTLINHCRWDRLVDVLPKLVLARSFTTFVLRIFEENGVKPRPLLYRISRG